MKKRMLCLLLAVGLILSFAACGTGDGGTTPPESLPPSASASSAPDAKTPEPDKDPEGIQMYSFTYGTTTDVQKVLDAVNAIAIPKAGVFIEALDLLNTSAYKEQMNLWLASQESYDLFITSTTDSIGDYAGQVANGYLMELDSLIDAYGQDVKSCLGDYWETARAGDGHIYGLTTRRDLATGFGIQLRKDFIDKYDVDMATMTTADAFAALYDTAAPQESGTAMALGVNGQRASFLMDGGAVCLMDRLGGSDGIGLASPHDATEITILAESESYLAACRKAYDWYQKGYMPMDVATTTTTGADMMRAGNLFSLITSMKAGQDAQVLKNTGKEVVGSMLVPPYATTSTVILFMWSIPIYSDAPEAAMKFYNLMFEDKDVINLLDWGIEGVHYEHKDGGFIGYPDGVSGDNVGWNPGLGWMFGDQFKSYIWEGGLLSVWDEQAAMNENAKKSLALGFIFDVTPVKTEFAAVNAVIGEFEKAIETGSIDPDATIPEFVRKLKSAGAEAIATEKQAQLDTFLSR